MTVFGLLTAVAGFVKVRYLIEKPIIDNMVFRAHYSITSAILFACSIMVTANNLIGDDISCISDSDVPGYVINTYCRITSTFTMPKNHNKAIGTQVAHSGLGLDDGEENYHRYYQWVPFMLFLQGILFYTPHWIWKQSEEGKVRMISEGMRGVQFDKKEEVQAQASRLAQYIFNSLHTHNWYAARYFLCEALNFVNVVGQIFFINEFLGGAFLTYGTDVLKFSNMDQEQRSDPMIQVFPRVTKCTFHKFGPSGSIVKLDALCILAANVLNEKIYIFLWFWFIILAILSGLALLYSTAILISPSMREFILNKRFKLGTSSDVSALVLRTQYGDFLLIHLLGQNLNMMMFKEVLDDLLRYLHVGPNSGGRTASPASKSPAPSTHVMSPISVKTKRAEIYGVTGTLSHE